MSPPLERITAQNLAFLSADDDRQGLHVSTLGIYAGPAPAFDEVVARVEEVLPLVPRARQHLKDVPFRMARPVWVDAHEFDVGRHVIAHEVHGADPTLELASVVEDIAARPLAQDRPLWELHVVEGLPDDRWALVSKSHQAIVDGVAGTPLLSVLLDSEPHQSRATARRWTPEPLPSDTRLITDALADLAIDPAELLVVLRNGLKVQGAVARWVTDRALAPFRGGGDHEAMDGLSGPVSRGRRWSAGQLPLDDIRSVRDVFGGSVHDVVLACAAGGFRALYEARGVLHPQSVARVIVPIAVDDADGAGSDGGSVAGEVTVVEAALPIGLADPLDRLSAIVDELGPAARSGVAGEVLASLAGNAVPLLLALGSRMATAAARRQRHLQAIITNVPGPSAARFFMGRELLESYPVVPIVDGVRVAVGAASYRGQVWLGVTGDLAYVPDVDLVRSGAEETLAVLVDLARR